MYETLTSGRGRMNSGQQIPLQTNASKRAREEYVSEVADFQYPASANLDNGVFYFRRVQKVELLERIEQANNFLTSISSVPEKLFPQLGSKEQQVVAKALRSKFCVAMDPCELANSQPPILKDFIQNRCTVGSDTDGERQTWLQYLEFFGVFDDYAPEIFEHFICTLLKEETKYNIGRPPQLIKFSRTEFFHNTSAGSLTAFAAEFAEARKTATYCFVNGVSRNLVPEAKEFIKQNWKHNLR